MLVGYMRVSKADGSQTTDLQRDSLLEASVDEDQLYQDHASGKKDDRPGLAACLKSLRDGDTLVVWKLDRLGRDLHHLVNTVHDLTARGIGLKVLTGQGAAIDTTTAAGKLVFGNLRRPGRIRTGTDLRTDRRGPGLSSSSGSCRRSALHDDSGEGTHRDGRDGSKGNEGSRALRRARHYEADAVPARLTSRRATPRRRESHLEAKGTSLTTPGPVDLIADCRRSVTASWRLGVLRLLGRPLLRGDWSVLDAAIKAREEAPAA